jgi:hypothetical protein
VYYYVRQNPWTMWDPRGLTADEMEVEQHEDETIGVYYRDNPRLGTGRSKTRERVGTLMADGFVDLGNGRKTSMAAIRDEIDSGGTDISKFRSDKSRTLSIDGENDGFGGAILGVDARIFEGVYGPEQFDQDRKLLHAAKQLSEVAVAQYIPGLAVAPALARELQFANAVRVLARTERGAAAATTGGKILWGFWDDYAKVTVNGREYAQVGNRLYTHHAVDRMTPSAFGTAAGAKVGDGAGRSVSPNFIEDVITTGTRTDVQVNGVTRSIDTSGSVEVVTEGAGRTVITVNPFKN